MADQPMSFRAERGRIELRMTCVPMGRDLAVTLCGGDQAHIGAVAVSQSRPSHVAGGPTSATTSVIALLGHKEDDLARALAGRFAARMDAAVTVACGIHMDALRPDDLKDIQEMADELTELALARFKAPWKSSAPPP